MSSDSNFAKSDFDDFDRGDHRHHKSGGHFRTKWASRIEDFVDRISNWPAENWLIFGAGLIIGAIVA